MIKSVYQKRIERMMRAYLKFHEDGVGFNECCDPIMKHRELQYMVGSDNTIPLALKRDVDEVLFELAWILEGARPLNFIEIANCFPICCQAMVAQYDCDVDSGVTHFAHTRNITMCRACFLALYEKIRCFHAYFPEIIERLNARDLETLSLLPSQ